MVRRSSSWRRKIRSRRGFTLLEVLIAFTILALSLAVIMQAFSTGFNSLEKARAHAVVALQARSKLAELGQTIPLEPGELNGEFDDGTVWRLSIEAADSGDEESGGGAEVLSVLALYKVEINVTKEKRATISLVTLRAAESLDF